MRRLLLFVVALEFSLVGGLPTSAQQSHRPGGSLDDPIERPRDLSGYSTRAPRVRVTHTTDAGLAGGSMYLQQVDPWLGYLLGRELTQREFLPQEGVYGEPSKPDGLLLPDGATHFITRDHVNACMACHNNPYRDAGAGTTIPKNGGTGRNTPHLFGAGLMEMLGWELRLAALRVGDDNRDGWIDLLEAKDKRFWYDPLQGPVTDDAGDTDDAERDAAAADGDAAASRESRAEPAEGEAALPPLDFGRFDDFNLDGKPDLNDVFYIVYVDAAGKRVPWAGKLTDPGVRGYRLEVQVFGHAQLRVSSRPPLQGTLRGFTLAAFDIHQGLQAFDPTILDERDGTGLSQVSNAGCPQFVTAAGRDRGRVLDDRGRSRDDPDRDGVTHELTEGDLDVVEWYLLNHPAPARGRQTARTRQGEALFTSVGCAACHTPDWRVPAASWNAADYTRRHLGDRRFFDARVAHNEQTRRLEGRVEWLADRVDNRWLPRAGEVVVKDLYSDLRYHDVGAEFHQTQFDGSVVRRFRTPPLWGVGSTAPYGHDGASLDLESVVLRHGGEARDSRDAFAALQDDEREAVLAFLRSLTLYQTDQLPCDINGDGRIDEEFSVAGKVVGRETLRPEWLLNTPCEIEGEAPGPLGGKVRSGAIVNLRAAYGLDLPYLKDADGDGWPDHR